MLMHCAAGLPERGSTRGGRGGASWNDRTGQYGERGRAWQPRGDPDAPRLPQLADKIVGEVLYGVNPVLGALQAMRRDCHTLYVQEGQSSCYACESPAAHLTCRCVPRSSALLICQQWYFQWHAFLSRGAQTQRVPYQFPATDHGRRSNGGYPRPKQGFAQARSTSCCCAFHKHL